MPNKVKQAKTLFKAIAVGEGYQNSVWTQLRGHQEAGSQFSPWACGKALVSVREEVGQKVHPARWAVPASATVSVPD